MVHAYMSVYVCQRSMDVNAICELVCAIRCNADGSSPVWGEGVREMRCGRGSRETRECHDSCQLVYRL